ADEAADDVVVGAPGDRCERGRALDRAEIHAGEPAEIALAGAGDRPGRSREQDRAVGEPGKAPDDAVRAGARDRSGGGGQGDHAGAGAAQRADEPAEHAVAAAADRAGGGAQRDDVVARPNEPAGDAPGADADVAARLRAADENAVEIWRRAGAHADGARRIRADRRAGAHAAGAGVCGADGPAGEACTARLHIALGNGRQNRAGVVADQAAHLQIRNVGTSDVSARGGAGNQALIDTGEPTECGASI